LKLGMANLRLRRLNYTKKQGRWGVLLPPERHCKRLAEQRVASPMEAVLFTAGIHLTVLLCLLI
jgi:hypothetical protein